MQYAILIIPNAPEFMKLHFAVLYVLYERRALHVVMRRKFVFFTIIFAVISLAYLSTIFYVISLRSRKSIPYQS